MEVKYETAKTRDRASIHQSLHLQHHLQQ